MSTTEDVYFIEEWRKGIGYWKRCGGQWIDQSYATLEEAIADIHPKKGQKCGEPTVLKFRIVKETKEIIKIIDQFE